MGNKLKYPRTLHLPNSPGVSNDDKVLKDLSVLDNKVWIVTEKMDGENTTMMNDCIYARSLDSNNHPSRNWVKGLWGEISYMISKGTRICGENLYAKHSIHYKDLKSYFLVFSIWNQHNVCLSHEHTLEMCEFYNLNMVPILGIFKGNQINIIPNFIKDNMEGVVIRNIDYFHFNDFQENVFKWVRKDHVQTDNHWSTQPIIKNELKK